MQSEENRWESFSFSSSGKKSLMGNTIYEPFSQEEFEKRSASGKYKEKDPITNRTIQEGEYLKGKPVGEWIQYDEDGDQRVFGIQSYRVGAMCKDGSICSATGRGACTGRGGVRQWLKKEKKQFLRGTGKYKIQEPVQDRLQKVRQEGIKLFGLQNTHNKQELEYHLYKEAVKFKKESNGSLFTKKKQQNYMKNYLQQIKQNEKQISELKVQINGLKDELQDQDEEIRKAKQDAETNKQLLKQKDSQIKNLKAEIERRDSMKREKKQKKDNTKVSLKVNDIKSDRNDSILLGVTLELKKGLLEKFQEKKAQEKQELLKSSINSYPSLPSYSKQKDQDQEITKNQTNVFCYQHASMFSEANFKKQNTPDPLKQRKQGIIKRNEDEDDESEEYSDNSSQEQSNEISINQVEKVSDNDKGNMSYNHLFEHLQSIKILKEDNKDKQN